MRAAVACVSDVRGLELRRGDVLVCDAGVDAARAGATRRDALEELLKRGVRVWSRPRLHAKVVVSGDNVIAVSANWSQRASTISVEAAIHVRGARTVAEARRFVDVLLASPSVEVTREFLARMPDPIPRENTEDVVEVADEFEGEGHSWFIGTMPRGRLRAGEREIAGWVDGLADRMMELQAGGRFGSTLIGPGIDAFGEIRPVDFVFQAQHDDLGTPYTTRPCSVVRVRRGSSVCACLVHAPNAEDEDLLSLRALNRALRACGMSPLSKDDSCRRLSPDETALFIAAVWPKATGRHRTTTTSCSAA